MKKDAASVKALENEEAPRIKALKEDIARVEALDMEKLEEEDTARFEAWKKEKERKSCQHEGCEKWAQGTGFCIAHGGGKRCQVQGCDNGAKGGTVFLYYSWRRQALPSSRMW